MYIPRTLSYVLSVHYCIIESNLIQLLYVHDNHRNRLKKLSCQHLYQHFNSDGHTEDDINIVPIEEIELTPTDKISLSAKRLEREEFWYRELCTVYP